MPESKLTWLMLECQDVERVDVGQALVLGVLAADHHDDAAAAKFWKTPKFKLVGAINFNLLKKILLRLRLIGFKNKASSSPEARVF